MRLEVVFSYFSEGTGKNSNKAGNLHFQIGILCTSHSADHECGYSSNIQF